ncbi:DUF3419 family protein [Spirosoma gilvum]
MLFYSHVNEDNYIERNALWQLQPHTLVGIVGSGERLLALMDAPSLQQVIAVDINPEAHHLFALKLATLKILSVSDYLVFIGHLPALADQRQRQLEQIWPQLAPDVQAYWEQRLSIIERGIVNAGHFERYLARLRPLVAFWLGSRFNECFTRPVAAIKGFPHWRWRGLMALFSQTWVYSLTGNVDLAFTASDCNNRLIAKALQYTLDHGTCASSYMFHLIFKGHLRDMSPTHLPPSLQPDVLERIQIRLRQGTLPIHVVTDDICHYLQQEPLPTEAIFLSLSDLLSFVTTDTVTNVLTETKARNKEAIIQGVIRSFLRHDFRLDSPAHRLHGFVELQDVSDQERTRMYKVYQFVL